MPSTRGLKAVKSIDIPAADLETCVDCGKNVLASHIADIVPIFKKGAKDDPTNYRPVSTV